MARHLNFNSAQTQTAAQTQPVQTAAQTQTAQTQTAQTQPVQTAAQTPLTDAQQLQWYQNEINGIDSQILNLSQRRGEIQSKCDALKNKLDTARKKEVEDLIKKAASKMGKTETEIRNLIKPLVDAGIDEIPTLKGMIGA